MIAWQNGALLWALPLAAAPVLIHLLRRHRADRLAFPSLRFVRAAQSAAVRIRRPSDLLLMLLRVAAVALAVVAAAGPVLLTSGRLDRWNRETARAIVVDVSDSMRVAEPDGIPPARAASDAATVEEQSARYATRIESTDLARAIGRAAAWLADAPPARREVVVVSDFQRGGFEAHAIANLDQRVGVRLVQVGRAISERQIAGPELLSAGDVPRRSLEILLSGNTTSVAMSVQAAEGRPGGLRLVPDDPSTKRLVRVAAAAGTPGGSSDEPIAIRFATDAAPAIKFERVQNGWMLRRLLRLQEEVDRVAHGTGSAVRSLSDSAPWSVLIRDASGKPLVAAASAGNELVLDVAASSDSFFAALVVRSALAARRAPADFDESEISRLDSASLSALGRPAAPIDLRALPPDAWRHANSTDSRWCWVVVLLLLGIEQLVRTRAGNNRRTEGSRVAA
jgi:hypothetical protein